MTKFDFLPYFLKIRLQNIEKYINKLYYNNYIAIKDYLIKFNLFSKINDLFWLLTEILFTGFIIHYSITHFNYLSLGLLSALITYYIEWFVKLVKRKEDETN